MGSTPRAQRFPVVDPPARRHPVPRAGRATVLVVDDERGIREFLASAFEAEGYAVLTAADGLEALARCEHRMPDVILLDLMMPTLDGPGFIREHRRRLGTGGPPIFIMSAVGGAIERAGGAGAAGTFPKPFDLDEVIEAVALVTGGASRGRPPAGPQREQRRLEA